MPTSKVIEKLTKFFS